MAIIDTIRRFFRRETVQPVTTIQETPKPRNAAGAALVSFSVETDRIGVVKKCREIYKGDPRAKSMHRKLARDLMRGGFTVQVMGGSGGQSAQRRELNGLSARAQSEANALISRLKLNHKLDDWIRLTARDGDSFLELGIDAGMNVSMVTRKPTLQMVRNCNEFDLFDDPERSYYWVEDEMFLGQGPHQDTLWFGDWQIVHARWEHDEGKKYGTPMLSSGNGHFKKVQEGELDIAVRRKTRSGMKYLHVVEGVDEAGIEAYREINQDALDNPFAAVSDYFSNKPGAITAIQGDARLQEIADVEHMISTWFMSGEVPMEILGYGANLNRDVLGEKKAAYQETIEALREWVSDQLITPLLERQWLLKGIYPQGVEYEITWLSAQIVTPAMVKDAAEAAARLKLLGVSDGPVLELLARFVPGLKGITLEGSEPPANSDEDGETGQSERIAAGAVVDAE